jgi:hypothetical protein
MPFLEVRLPKSETLIGPCLYVKNLLPRDRERRPERDQNNLRSRSSLRSRSRGRRIKYLKLIILPRLGGDDVLNMDYFFFLSSGTTITEPAGFLLLAAKPSLKPPFFTSSFSTTAEGIGVV